MVNTKRGQAELIGGMIVVTALLMSLGMILVSIIGTSSTSISGISRRTQFELERSLEKLTAVYRGNTCYLKNAGLLPIRVARVWIDSSVVELGGEHITIEAGEEISSISTRAGHAIDIQSIDLLVTVRGNIFQPKTMCENVKPIYHIIRQEFLGYFTSEHILNPVRVVSGLSQGYLYAEIKSGGSTYRRPVVYKDPSSGTWYCSYSADNKGTISGIKLNHDIDNNNVNEIIIVDTTSCIMQSPAEWSTGSGRVDVVVSFVFKQLAHIPETATIDTISVFFRLILSGPGIGGAAQQITIAPTVIINSTNVTLSAPGTVTSAGTRSDLVIASGVVIFPVKAFNLDISPGVYDLRLDIGIVAGGVGSSGIRVRLEYMAVIGMEFNLPWGESRT